MIEVYLPIMSEESGHSKVGYFKMVILVKQQVLWLEIPVCNTPSMEVFLP